MIMTKITNSNDKPVEFSYMAPAEDAATITGAALAVRGARGGGAPASRASDEH